jgi:protein-S-isoprenylcysteine O-methyltransferase Ste14
VEWLTKATQREYGTGKKVAALVLGQVLFLVVYPAFIGVGAYLIDRWLHIPRLVHGLVSPVAALLLIVPGMLLVEWTIGLQFVRGLGTPIPVVATRQLITTGPYSYSRNPMATGTTMVYVGIAVYIGSLWAVVLASIYPMVIAVYTKLVEEKELERRFGVEYVAYKRRTPFLFPRLPRRGWPDQSRSDG